MKKTLFLSLVILLVATSALAAASTDIIFNRLSSSGTSAAFRINGSKKSVALAAYSTSTTTNATGNALRGTFALECGPTSSGPWVTCKDQAGNAVSTTSLAVFNLSDAFTWLRGKWTKNGLGNVKAWLLGKD